MLSSALQSFDGHAPLPEEKSSNAKMLQLLIPLHAPLDPILERPTHNFLLLSTTSACVDAATDPMDAQLPSDPVDRPADV